MAGKISEYPAKTVFDDTDLYDCSTTGTVSEKVTYSQIKEDLKNTFHTQGGNSYGTDLTIGTNDGNDVIIETAGTEAVRVDTNLNVGTQRGIQHGFQTASARDVYLRKSVLTERQVSIFDGYVSQGLIGSYDDVVQVSVLIEGLNGVWYSPEHTLDANSIYHIRISNGGSAADVQIYVPSTSTNFALTSKVKITTSYMV